MCDGGDGGGGLGGPAHGGEVGNQAGGNVGGGSGGNVGPGFGGGTGGLPTSKNDPPAFGSSTTPASAPTGEGSFYGGWEEASMPEQSSPVTGALGFSPLTGAKYGGLIGSIFGGLPGLAIGTAVGGVAGLATGQGSVDDYGGGDPDAGGGPGEGYVLSARGGGLRKPDEISVGDIVGSFGSNPTEIGGGEREGAVDGTPFRLTTTPDIGSVSRYFNNEEDDDLLKTIVFGEDEFTKNLF